MRGHLSRRVVALSAAAATLGACGGGEPTSAPVTSGIPLMFCATASPTWVAYQDDAGAWTQSVADATGLFHVAINTRGAIALVRGSTSTGAFQTYVEYATAAELTAQYASCARQAVVGSKALQGSIAGLGNAEAAEITMGGVSAAGFTNFNMSGVADGPLDLIAARLPTGIKAFGPPTAIILRRGINLATGSVLPVLDFSGNEAFQPAAFTVTIGNLGSDSVAVSVNFLTSTQTYATLMSDTAAASSTQTYVGIPAAQLATGDLHDVLLVAGTSQSARFYETFTHALSNQTMTLGAELTAPTVTLTAATPVIRPRMQSTIQPEYNSVMEIDYFQCRGCFDGQREVSMVMTAAYAGAGATSWDMTVPDFTKVPGYIVNWGLQPGASVQWDADGAGGVTISDLAGHPADGLSLHDAARVGVAPSSQVVTGREPSTISVPGIPTGGAQRRREEPSLILDVKRARSQREYFSRRQ